MRAYKFLDAHGRAPFTLTPWPVGEWVETATVVPCREGVHACRPGDLAYWLGPVLWEVELEGAVVETRHKLTASRGRLVAPVTGYQEALRELGEVCAWRSRDRALVALEAEGVRAFADRLRAASSLEALRALEAAVDDTTFARTAAALAVDAATFVLRDLPTEAPFIGACSAGHAAAGPTGDQAAFDAGYDEERTVESWWLVDRLDLARN